MNIKWGMVVLVYVGIGFAVDYALYSTNAPAAIGYSPRPNVILAWPYYGARYV